MKLFISTFFEPLDASLQTFMKKMVQRSQKCLNHIEVKPEFKEEGFYIAHIGGYNAIHAFDEKLSLIDLEKIKGFCGYSDLTTFLLYLVTQGHQGALHGPMFLCDFTEYDIVDPKTWESFHKALKVLQDSKNFAQTWEVLPELEWVNWFEKKRFEKARSKVIAPKFQVTSKSFRHARGISLGGNLSIFSRLVATSLFPHVHLKRPNILFFEEWETKCIDILNQLRFLKFAGVFNNTQVILFGDVRESEFGSHVSDSDFYQKVAEISACPVVFNLPFGHRQPQYSFFLGWDTQVSFYDDQSKAEINQQA
jgi:muramoyltetrapeptide carboxypeptidase LdcA involved in peptidoglycan recycling